MAFHISIVATIRCTYCRSLGGYLIVLKAVCERCVRRAGLHLGIFWGYILTTISIRSEKNSSFIELVIGMKSSRVLCTFRE